MKRTVFLVNDPVLQEISNICHRMFYYVSLFKYIAADTLIKGRIASFVSDVINTEFPTPIRSNARVEAPSDAKVEASVDGMFDGRLRHYS